MFKNILAIDIGGSKMLAGLIQVSDSGPEGELNFEIQQTVGEKLPAEISEAEILEKINSLSKEILQKKPLEEIDSIGVTIPGLADERVWIYAPFSGIQNFQIVNELEKLFPEKRICIENDVNACAIAEGMFGACRKVRDFIWLTISNGIGGGVVLNGQIYRGARGFSGEFGHLNVVPDGELCGCGNRGCMEAECAGPGISRYYSHLTEISVFVPASEIAARAEAGEEEALETFRREGRVLGHALANAANILNPEKIIIGGGVSRAWKLFIPTLEETFRKNVFHRANDSVRIEPTALGYEAALIGAAALPLVEK